MSEEHTPIPWRIAPKSLGGVGRIYTPKHGRIATVTNTYPDDEAKANAHFFVRACNNHKRLLEACKALVQFCESKDRLEDDGPAPTTAYNLAKAAIEEAERK